MQNLIRQQIELFHLLFLDELSRKIDQRLYALKGGCNLRFFFNSIRYSEDMDIDVKIIAKETLQKNVNNLLHSKPFELALNTRAIRISHVSLPKQTETTQRWKIQLNVTGSRAPINTKVEFSRRGISEAVKFETVNSSIIQAYKLSPLFVSHYVLQAAFDQKINALISRKETQSRDVFDLYILLQQGADIKRMNKRLLGKLSEAQSNASNLTFADYKGQVLAYLPDEYQSQYDSKTTWDHIVLSVLEAMEI